MEIYLDTANLEQIKHYSSLGLIDGVTTNPALLAKEKITIDETINHIKKICEFVKGFVSVEVYSNTINEMITEAMEYSKIASNVVIKLPATESGLEVASKLNKQNIKTNITLVFSPSQAILAAKTGATLVSPFVGRLDDAQFDGTKLIADIRKIYDNYGIKTKILSASFRSLNQIVEVAKIGTDIATISPELLAKMHNHPFTTIGLESFQDATNSLKKL
jgi:transaldolase